VFLAVWTKRRQYQFPRTFKSWLYAIAVNKCRAAFRVRSLPGSLSLSDNAADVPITAEPSPVLSYDDGAATKSSRAPARLRRDLHPGPCRRHRLGQWLMRQVRGRQ